ncbi:hypothetical protein PVL30_004448 [Lodderomyces elongisporus]|uniref:uncharacterized protein n=1 Tax=Lodderomyces elongisporus TaxID=36914 RepID=UPI00292706F5|nr:uncharacterized protein PVL30_004448 [Lodderomyces elongisporus]WLF80662.1 hypothetical protein PVL30_004448 [Lodderomyces elongisporus]
MSVSHIVLILYRGEERSSKDEFNLFGNSFDARKKTSTAAASASSSSTATSSGAGAGATGNKNFVSNLFGNLGNNGTVHNSQNSRVNGNNDYGTNQSFTKNPLFASGMSSSSSSSPRTSLLNPWANERVNKGFNSITPSINHPFKDINNGNYSSKLHDSHPPSTKLEIEPQTHIAKDWNSFLSSSDGNLSNAGYKSLNSQETEKQVEPKPKQKSRSRLGQLFSIFTRGDKSSENNKNLDKRKRGGVNKYPTSIVTPRSLATPSYKAVDIRRTGHMKRLILKNKPVKYHLIDVNKILSARKNRVVVGTVSAEGLLRSTASHISKNSSVDDDDDDDYENDDDDIEDINGNPELGELEEEPTRKVFSKRTFDITNDKNNLVSDKREEVEVQQEQNQSSTEDTINEKNTPQFNGYWTSPPIEEIMEMSFEELRFLENFIIGRTGFGQIAYDYPVDLTAAKRNAELHDHSLAEELFENIIQFRPQTVMVYKDVLDKPYLGTELNVPATITLEGIVSKKKTVNEQIEFLKKQEGMEYISYNPSSSTWVFRVKHFSIWGLVDEDDENQKELLKLKRKQDEKEAEATLEYSRVYESADVDQEIKKQKLNEHAKIVPGGWSYAAPQRDHILHLKRSLVNNEVERELSRYNDEETSQLNAQVDGIILDSDDEGYDFDREVVVEEESEADGTVIEPKINAYEPIIEDESVFDKIRNNMVVSTADNWLLQLELANQFDSSFAPFAVETEKSREKLTLSKVDSLLFPEYSKSPSLAKRGDFGLDSIVEDQDDELKVALVDKNVESILNTVLRTSTFTAGANKFPKLQKSGRLQFSQFCGNSYVGSEIELASILFDDEKRSKLETLRMFGDWLNRYNESTVEELLSKHSTDYLECAFICLCANQPVKAIQYALKSKSEHLATILSMADARSKVVESAAKQQLSSWRSNCQGLVPTPVVKIYQILARDLDALSENLPWNLAIKLNLAFGDVKDVKVLVQQFAKVLPKGNSVADILDIYLNGFDFDKIIDSSLNNTLRWLFCLVLANFNYDKISESFGKQLEVNGLWKDSILVYTSIEDDDKSKNFIRKVIIGQIGKVQSFTKGDEMYLTVDLKVPESLIYEAMAIERRNRGEYWGEIEMLLKYFDYDTLHKTLITQLGPDAAISCSKLEIARLREVIKQIPQYGKIIPNWNHGMGIYENYFALLEQPQDVEILNFMIDNLPLTKLDSDSDVDLDDNKNQNENQNQNQNQRRRSEKEKIALNLISKYVGDLALEASKVALVRRQRVLEFPLDEVNKQYFESRVSFLK